jgi:hypothetical protein
MSDQKISQQPELTDLTGAIIYCVKGGIDYYATYENLLKSVFIYYTTVGATGQYATVQLALAAGKRYLKLVDDVEETINWDLSGSIVIDGYKETGTNYKLTFTNASISSVSATQNIYLRNIDITVNNSAKVFITGQNSNVYIEYDKGTFEFTGTAGSINMANTSGAVCKWNNVVTKLNNGTDISFLEVIGSFRNGEINGSSSSCKKSFYTHGDASFENYLFTGTYGQSLGAGQRHAVIYSFSGTLSLYNCDDNSATFSVAKPNYIKDCEGQINIEGYTGSDALPVVENSSVYIFLDRVYRIFTGTLKAINSAVQIVSDTNSATPESFGSIDMIGGSLTFTRTYNQPLTIGDVILRDVAVVGSDWINQSNVTINSLDIRGGSLSAITTFRQNLTVVINTKFTSDITIQSNNNIFSEIKALGNISVTGNSNDINGHVGTFAVPKALTLQVGVNYNVSNVRTKDGTVTYNIDLSATGTNTLGLGNAYILT